MTDPLDSPPQTDRATGQDERLIRLDDLHYFDPLNRQVLSKDADSGEIKYLGHRPEFVQKTAAMVEEEARQEGFKPVEGGLFWNPDEKRLYVKSGDHYVLFALDRRDDADAN